MALILALFRWFRSAPPGPRKQKGVVMSLAVAKFERAIDRVAPAVLLALGLASAGAMALIGG